MGEIANNSYGVPHDGLLHKLILSGVPLGLARLLQSYLSGRSFRVHAGTTSSVELTVPAGVPQGSVLGPHLFLLYLNDLPKQPHTQLACFADDTASLTSSQDVDLIISRLQLSIDLLCDFFTTWKLKLNASKTEAILFTRKRKLPNRKLRINNHTIPWSKSVKYLGIYFDPKVNWTFHIDMLRTKGARQLNALSPILNRKSNLSSFTKLRIYTTLVRPCITYASPVWGNTCNTNHEKLQILQNKALKIAYNTPFYTNLRLLHEAIKLPTLKTFIHHLSRKFYLETNKKHSNRLISDIGTTRYHDLPYIDKYKSYRLPHHCVLDHSPASEHLSDDETIQNIVTPTLNTANHLPV